MSIIDGALSANTTIAEDFDPKRGEPPRLGSLSSRVQTPG